MDGCYGKISFSLRQTRVQIWLSPLGMPKPVSLADSLCQLPEPVQWLAQATLQLLPAC